MPSTTVFFRCCRYIRRMTASGPIRATLPCSRGLDLQRKRRGVQPGLLELSWTPSHRGRSIIKPSRSEARPPVPQPRHNDSRNRNTDLGPRGIQGIDLESLGTKPIRADFEPVTQTSPLY